MRYKAIYKTIKETSLPGHGKVPIGIWVGVTAKYDCCLQTEVLNAAYVREHIDDLKKELAEAEKALRELFPREAPS